MNLAEADFDVGAVFHVGGFDEADAGRGGVHDDGLRVAAIGGEADAAEEIAVGDTAGGEDKILAWAKSCVL